MRPDRRKFIQQTICAALGGASVYSALGQMQLLQAATRATTFTDYKALVCVFLYGGNDAFNMIVPPAIRANLAGRAADYEATLRSLQIPVLALHGAEDTINLPAMADYTCATTRNSRKILYPGVAHMPFWEVPEAFDRDVGEFLRTS